MSGIRARCSAWWCGHGPDYSPEIQFACPYLDDVLGHNTAKLLFLVLPLALSGTAIGLLVAAPRAALRAPALRPSAAILATTAVVTLLYAAGADDDTGNNASRWAVHEAAHSAITTTVLLVVAGVVSAVLAAHRPRLLWLVPTVSLAAAASTCWTLLETSH
jgi:hypothetical protein